MKGFIYPSNAEIIIDAEEGSKLYFLNNVLVCFSDTKITCLDTKNFKLLAKE